MVKVTLNVVEGKADRQQVVLTLPAIIGRGAEADLVIVHPEISRHHCRLFVHQNLVHIQDLHSLNGTLVGDKRLVNAQSVILPGERFSLGPIAVEIQYSKIDTSSTVGSHGTSGSRGSSTGSTHSTASTHNTSISRSVSTSHGTNSTHGPNTPENGK